jgi:hypothetical protein
MLLSEHKDLKMEIKSLPEKEKDKLLLRLIAKDKVLTEHLHFKLLENESDLVQRFEQLFRLIDKTIAELLSVKKLNSKETLLQMRKLNGSINHHFKVTKDTATELELRIHLLDKVPITFNESVFSALHRYNEKLNVYVVRTCIAALNKYKKLHEDVQFDLKEALNAVLTKIYKNNASSIAVELGLTKEI